MALLAAFLIGAVAGLRTMTAAAAVCWAAALGWIDVSGTWLAFLGYAYTPWLVTAFALLEFITDQLPGTPSRTVPIQFGARILIGAVAGAAMTAAGSPTVGLAAGAIGAIAGTLGGRAFRARLTAAFGADRPAALVEDAVAVVAAALIAATAR